MLSTLYYFLEFRISIMHGHSAFMSWFEENPDLIPHTIVELLASVSSSCSSRRDHRFKSILNFVSSVSLGKIRLGAIVGLLAWGLFRTRSMDILTVR